MIGLLLGGAFVAVIVAYLFTEFLLRGLDVRRRVLLGEGFPLLIILGANVLSFVVIWISFLVVDVAAGIGAYRYSAIICLGAQAVWLTQHLWVYHRDHLRLRYE